MKLDLHHLKSDMKPASSTNEDRKWKLFCPVFLAIIILALNSFGLYLLRSEFQYHLRTIQEKQREEIQTLTEKCGHLHKQLKKLRDSDINQKVGEMRKNMAEQVQHALQTAEMQTLSNNLSEFLRQITEAKDQQMQTLIDADMALVGTSIDELHHKISNNSMSIHLLEIAIINLFEEIEFSRAEIAFVIAPILKQSACLYAPEVADVRDKTITINYDANMNCLYTIRAPKDRKIQYWFESFETENGPDYLEIMDGPKISTYFGNASLHPKIQRILKPRISQRNILHFRFVTDKDDENEDLKLHFKLV